MLQVEQNPAQSTEIADRGYVMVNGRIEITGSAAELRVSPEIRDAYLGVALALKARWRVQQNQWVCFAIKYEIWDRPTTWVHAAR